MKRQISILAVLLMSLTMMADNIRDSYQQQWTDMVENAVEGFKFRFYNQKDINSLDAISVRRPIEEVFSEESLLPLLSLEERSLRQLEESGITDISFISLQRKTIRWTVWQFMLNIVHLGAINNNMPIPQYLYDRVNEMVFDDTEILDFPGFPVLVNYFIEAMLMQGRAGDSFDHYVARCIQTVPSEKIRSKFIEVYFQQLMQENHLERLRQLFDYAITTIEKPSRTNLRRTELQIDSLTNNHPYNGQPAPVFTFEDVNGKQVCLKDLRGKYVMIDIWATWCGPCKKQIPFMKEVERQLKGSDIVFVSLSSDEQKERVTWQRMVQDLQPGDINLIATNGFNDPFIQHYGLEYIPHFMLIGPDGRMISYSCRKPRDPLFIMYLKQILEKQ
ncbi:MAG: TlpA family protein disulfide reductase [Prevotella sp.]|nr:TlpA family protein disulfide reductase [Prevotella sp.]MBR1462045.1 TlpA family protein disulfide reductase [Prevotella sp.]